MPTDRRASAQAAMTLRAPGWYPDPEGSDADRWWNGTAWTDGVRRPADEGAAPDGTVPVQRQDVRAALAKARSEALWAPPVLGLLAAIGVALVPVLHVIGVAFITLAVAAVLTGVKALGLRAKGVPLPVLPPVLGIVLGSISGLLLALALVGSLLVRLL